MSIMWFGKRLAAPAYADCPQTETPAGRACIYCAELIVMGDNGWILVDGSTLHRECYLRGFTGSLAHQRKSCSCYGGGDEEDGMTRREGALAAVRYFERNDY
jgi:hypothetical protein